MLFGSAVLAAPSGIRRSKETVMMNQTQTASTKGIAGAAYCTSKLRRLIFVLPD
ncbi:hypothetical protein PHLCEN_2v3132 [Hermanssonia centrifuga]|uniref:Uncharacterized protein n=1 Tax=Hermanssonia centrifuga TaxID=98765 RepID=A0A2R6R3Y2_9APHY|nr:hypothetical protein PHLCEN_2v3132 [Hermanssonia centrifuga]